MSNCIKIRAKIDLAIPVEDFERVCDEHFQIPEGIEKWHNDVKLIDGKHSMLLVPNDGESPDFSDSHMFLYYNWSDCRWEGIDAHIMPDPERECDVIVLRGTMETFGTWRSHKPLIRALARWGMMYGSVKIPCYEVETDYNYTDLATMDEFMPAEVM